MEQWQTNEERSYLVRKSELTTAILDYLAQHPQTMDTVEGIAEWWLLRQQIRIGFNAVAQVVRELTEKGILEEVRSGEFQCYRLKAVSPPASDSYG
jgi:Fe2+ or Zn2+ uptake regulation protein